MTPDRCEKAELRSWLRKPEIHSLNLDRCSGISHWGVLDEVTQVLNELIRRDVCAAPCSVSGPDAGEVAEHGFEHLKAPVKMVTALDTPVPYSEPLEDYILPNEGKIVSAVKAVLKGQTVAA